MIKDIREVKCKCCGGSNFCLQTLFQSTKQYPILTNGRISKKGKFVDRNSPMGCENIVCADCGELMDGYYEDKNGVVQVLEGRK